MTGRRWARRATNIFSQPSPVFSYKPKYIVGRNNEISEFMKGIADMPYHPNRSTFFIGQRSLVVGKV